jgi:hypothetical protein
MKQIFHNYKKWEEYKAGMWRIPCGCERDIMTDKALRFMSDTKLFGSHMLEVIDLWVYSCEHNLTSPSQNRQAWIGQAACCLGANCPESITRLAWRLLTKKQQAQANAMADSAIYRWKTKHTLKKPQQTFLFDT